MVLGIPFCNPEYYCSPNNCKSLGQPSVIKNTTWKGHHTFWEQQRDGCILDRRHHIRDMGTTRQDSSHHSGTRASGSGIRWSKSSPLTAVRTVRTHALQEGGGAGERVEEWEAIGSCGEPCGGQT